LASAVIPDVQLLGNGQFFPRFTWSPPKANDGGLFADGASSSSQQENSIYGQVGEEVDGYRRVDNITDEIKNLFCGALGSDITSGGSFHFVAGKLHAPEYTTKYAADLTTMLPHIEPPATRAEFEKFVVAGKALMALD